MTQIETKVYRCSNGLTIIAEEIPLASSAAFSLLVPIGAARDPEGEEGAAVILAEMFHKGAGPWGTRELSDQFEQIGAHRSHAAGIEVSTFSVSLLAENLYRAIELYGTVLLEPHLPESELESVRQLALQELDSLEDEPSAKVMVELAQRFYPPPFGRCQLGTRSGLEAVTAGSLREYFQRFFKPAHSVIGIAGKFDWKRVIETVEKAFGSWQGEEALLQPKPFGRENRSDHVQRDTSQLQIALAYPSAALSDLDFYAAKVAVGVLSGGMAGRLFIEVREKLGLVYRVSASHSATRGRAAVFVYAGTTPENGAKTLEVTLRELNSLSAGASPEELERAKADLKSRLVMQAELSSVRASGLVNDWWNLGRVRPIAEIKERIDAVTSDAIVQHLERFPVKPIVLVTLGSQKLELPA